MSSKINIYIFLCLIFFPISGFSQIGAKIDSSAENYKQAVQFYIVNQVIAGYKYQFSENKSIRFIINASGLFNRKDADNIEYVRRTYDTLYGSVNRQTITTNQFYEIKIQYLFQNKLNNIVKLYYGGGPFFNYRFTRSEEATEQKYTTGEIYNYYYRRDENIWNIGISSVIGIECKVYKNISVFSEYEAILYFGKQNNENYTENQNFRLFNDKYDIWGYELRGLRIGLGVYF
jgi:hypothetical protein